MTKKTLSKLFLAIVLFFTPINDLPDVTLPETNVIVRSNIKNKQ